MRKIVIAGGSGFLGQELKRYFQKCGDSVVVLTRQKKEASDCQWDGQTLGEWQSCLKGVDVLINLSGRTVDCRYNEVNKREIIESRQKSTAILGEAVNLIESPPKIWLNASTATIYAHSNGKRNDEDTGEIGQGFSVGVAEIWEKTFFDATVPETVRKVCMRMAIILAAEGPFMQVMKKLVKLRLGGRQGSGEQQFSWMHIGDFIAAIEWLICHEDQKGIFNLAAPNPEKNKDVMASLREVCGVKMGLPAPELLVRIGAFFMRTEAELPLKSRCVVPKRLLGSGFEFKYTQLSGALESLV